MTTGQAIKAANRYMRERLGWAERDIKALLMTSARKRGTEWHFSYASIDCSTMFCLIVDADGQVCDLT